MAAATPQVSLGVRNSVCCSSAACVLNLLIAWSIPSFTGLRLGLMAGRDQVPSNNGIGRDFALHSSFRPRIQRSNAGTGDIGSVSSHQRKVILERRCSEKTVHDRQGPTASRRQCGNAAPSVRDFFVDG